MDQEYSYPLDIDWSTDEVVDVAAFYEAVETGYTHGIKAYDLKNKYRRFKEIVPSKAEEKTLFKQFENSSGYVPFKLTRQLKDSDDNDIITP